MSFDLFVFDLDNTLYCERDYLELVFSRFEKARGLKPCSLISSFDKLDRYASNDLLSECLKGAGLAVQSNHDGLFDDYQNASGALQVNTSVAHLIKEIRKRSIPIAILTNGVPSVQRNKIKLLGVHKVVEAVFFAREIGEGQEKPAPEVFLKVLDYFSVPAHRAVMIGDNMKNDIIGAEAVGMTALHYSVGWEHGESILKKFAKEFLDLPREN